MAANQHQPDPRQTEFLAAYLNPDSDTFGNALRSALKAGYSQEYAESITHKMPTWLADKVGNNNRLKKAEAALDEALGYITLGEDGKVDASVAKVKTDVAKFIAERIGRNTYSTRKELTGKDGGPLEVAVEQREQIEQALDDV